MNERFGFTSLGIPRFMSLSLRLLGKLLRPLRLLHKSPPQETETGETKEKFTGKEFDTDGASEVYGLKGMNLNYFGARYYDPVIGVFIATDPLEEFWNPYTYGPGNPINGTDPDGNSWQERLAGGVTGALFGFSGSVLTEGTADDHKNSAIIGGVFGAIAPHPVVAALAGDLIGQYIPQRNNEKIEINAFQTGISATFGLLGAGLAKDAAPVMQTVVIPALETTGNAISNLVLKYLDSENEIIDNMKWGTFTLDNPIYEAPKEETGIEKSK